MPDPFSDALERGVDMNPARPTDAEVQANVERELADPSGTWASHADAVDAEIAKMEAKQTVHLDYAGRNAEDDIAVCIRCQQDFDVTIDPVDRDRCPRDPSGEGHEALAVVELRHGWYDE